MSTTKLKDELHSSKTSRRSKRKKSRKSSSLINFADSDLVTTRIDSGKNYL